MTDAWCCGDADGTRDCFVGTFATAFLAVTESVFAVDVNDPVSWRNVNEAVFWRNVDGTAFRLFVNLIERDGSRVRVTAH